jgi:hypothetical protein
VSLPVPSPSSGHPAPARPSGRSAPARPSTLRLAVRLGSLSALGLGLGASAGVAWWAIATPPAYRVNTEGRASTTERGLASFIGGDAWFVALGLVVGVALGWLAWRRFRGLGWPIVPVVLVVALAAELVCWFVGSHLGPGDFNTRLAAAKPGDIVPIELTLRTGAAALLSWPFFAVVPVLLGSSLGRDDEEPRPIFRRRAEPDTVPQPPAV